jgi:hypothetical protein
VRANAAARAGLVAVAVVVLAWLVVMERDARLLARGLKASQQLSDKTKTTCSRSRSTAPDCRAFSSAVSDLRAASLLNPDTTPDLYRGVLEWNGRLRLRAVSVESVLRQEPNNINAWVELVAVGLLARDQHLFRRAESGLHRLDPLAPSGG